MSSLGTSSTVPSYNPYPDEKGTESFKISPIRKKMREVTIPTPMKRGLKAETLNRSTGSARKLQPIPRRKGD